MRKLLWLIFVAGLASCSSPQKMVYYFDHYVYKSVRKDPANIVPVNAINGSKSLQAPSMETLVATTDEQVVPEPAVAQTVEPVMSRGEAVEHIKNMSKEERKEFKRELKKEIKKIKKSPSPKAAKAMGGDMRNAAIFGAIGIVLLIIGGDVLYIIGAVALLIGLYFFVRYLSNH